MNTATFIREIEGWKGHASLYKLSEPLGWPEENKFDFVIASAVNAFGDGPETYLFGSNEQGVVLDWMELPGSMKGTWSHSEALKAAGYIVADAM